MTNAPDSSGMGQRQLTSGLFAHPALSSILLFCFIMLPTTVIVFGQPNSSLDTQRAVSVTVANGCIAGYLSLVIRRLERRRAQAERRVQELSHQAVAGD